VHWSQKDGCFELNVTVPTNTTATIYLPSRDQTPVMEGKAPVEGRAGITFVKREGDRAVYQVESGSYAFTSTW
jgi:hypothetical protein